MGKLRSLTLLLLGCCCHSQATRQDLFGREDQPVTRASTRSLAVSPPTNRRRQSSKYQSSSRLKVESTGSAGNDDSEEPRSTTSSSRRQKNMYLYQSTAASRARQRTIPVRRATSVRRPTSPQPPQPPTPSRPTTGRQSTAKRESTLMAPTIATSSRARAKASTTRVQTTAERPSTSRAPSPSRHSRTRVKAACSLACGNPDCGSTRSLDPIEESDAESDAEMDEEGISKQIEENGSEANEKEEFSGSHKARSRKMPIDDEDEGEEATDVPKPAFRRKPFRGPALSRLNISPPVGAKQSVEATYIFTDRQQMPEDVKVLLFGLLPNLKKSVEVNDAGGVTVIPDMPNRLGHPVTKLASSEGVPEGTEANEAFRIVYDGFPKKGKRPAYARLSVFLYNGTKFIWAFSDDVGVLSP